MTQPDGYITKADAAEALGVSTRTVERLAARGLLVIYRHPLTGGTSLLLTSEVEALLDSQPEPVDE